LYSNAASDSNVGTYLFQISKTGTTRFFILSAEQASTATYYETSEGFTHVVFTETNSFYANYLTFTSGVFTFHLRITSENRTNSMLIAGTGTEKFYSCAYVETSPTQLRIRRIDSSG